MTFYELNRFFWNLPDFTHTLAFALLVALYTHLFYGFWLVRHRIPGRVCNYFVVRSLIAVAYFFFKAEDQTLKLFDLFYPLFLINYLDGLIILNGWGLYRCKSLRLALIKLITFRSRPK